MYAVIKSGGKQYKVAKGDVLLLEKLEGKEGDKVRFEEILLLSSDDETIADQAKLSKAIVRGTVLEQTKGDKVIVFKYKPKKGYKKRQGHRQELTKVRIDEIKLSANKQKPVGADISVRPSEGRHSREQKAESRETAKAKKQKP